MNTMIAWILVAVSSSGAGSGGFAVPSFSPPVASEADCKLLLDAAQRVVKLSDGRSKSQVMERKCPLNQGKRQ
jgi:hypothetical protein